MVAENARFNHEARTLLASDVQPSPRGWLYERGFSGYFAERLLVPQASAVLVEAKRGTRGEHRPAETPQNAHNRRQLRFNKIAGNRTVSTDRNLHGKEGCGSPPVDA